MANRANPTVIGAFVVGAVFLFVGGLIVFGGGSFLRDDQRFIAYFEGSVEGLDVGAPIKYRGVKVGTVTKIHTVWDPAEETIRIPVELSFTNNQLENEGEFQRLTPDQAMDKLVDLGLRAQLHMGSFVTGKLHVEMDFMPDADLNYVGDTELHEVPTVPNPLEQLKRSIEHLPLDEIAENANEAIRAVHDLLTDPEVKDLVSDLRELSRDVGTLSRTANAAIEDVRVVLNRNDAAIDSVAENLTAASSDLRILLSSLGEQVGPLSESTQLTLSDIRKVLAEVDNGIDPVTQSLEQTMADIRGLVARLDDAAGGDYTLLLQLRDLLNETSEAARSLKALSDYLQRRPEALLSGKK